MVNNSVNATSSSAASTFCMGRFLIDVPAGSRQTGGNYKYDFLAIEPVKSLTFEGFEEEVVTHESSLKNARNDRTKMSMLLQSVRPEKHTRIFASWKSDASTAQVAIFGYRWIDGQRFLFKDSVDNNKQKIGVENMGKVLSLLRARTEADIPNEPGYCFADGFIANAEWENEEAGVDFRIAGHLDTIVSVWFYPLSSFKHDKPLLERMGGMTQVLGNLATSVHVLRKGDRQVGPYKGQEHLASAPNSGGMRGHAFVWETQGEGTLETPAIKIELSTGHSDRKDNPQKTSLTDEQAMTLWDDILNSFRLRPTGDAVKTSGIAPEPSPRLPLGELVATGRTCPQTGWWQASEAGEVEGGARRYFKAGDAMPQVTTLGEPSLWEKLKGARPSYRTATVWKLVDYDTEVSPAQSIAQADAHGRNDEPPHHDKG
ncbi:MAG: hypothetical protein JF619_22920 [Massilia sp.]|nr:hypothetical protein [Massilia sp.]